MASVVVNNDEKASWNYLIDDIREMIRKEYCSPLTWHILSLTCKQEQEHQQPVPYYIRSEQACVLQMALYEDDLRIVKWQASNNMEDGVPSQFIRWVAAFECGHVAMVEWLLDAGIVVLRSNDPWSAWCQVPALHPYNPDLGPYLAAKEGHLQLLKFMVKWQIRRLKDIASLVHSALMGALLGGQVHVLEWLVSKFIDTGLPVLFQSLLRYERVHPDSLYEISHLLDPEDMFFPFPVSVLEWLWERPWCLWFRSFLDNEMFYRCFRFRWPMDNVRVMDTARWLNDKTEGKWSYAPFFTDTERPCVLSHMTDWYQAPFDEPISGPPSRISGYTRSVTICYEIKR